MNKRLEELAEQAKELAEQAFREDNAKRFTVMEKFAELIVRQCIGMVLPYNEEDPCAERLYELADTIGEHFGVEQ